MGPEPARQTMYLIFTEYTYFGSESTQVFFLMWNKRIQQIICQKSKFELLKALDKLFFSFRHYFYFHE